MTTTGRIKGDFTKWRKAARRKFDPVRGRSVRIGAVEASDIIPFVCHMDIGNMAVMGNGAFQKLNTEAV